MLQAIAGLELAKQTSIVSGPVVGACASRNGRLGRGLVAELLGKTHKPRRGGGKGYASREGPGFPEQGGQLACSALLSQQTTKCLHKLQPPLCYLQSVHSLRMSLIYTDTHIHRRSPDKLPSEQAWICKIPIQTRLSMLDILLTLAMQCTTGHRACAAGSHVYN